MHDLIAELEGYRNELSAAERRGNDDKAKDIRKEVARVAKAVNARVDELTTEADRADEALEDLTAAQRRAEARRMARALPERLRGPSARRLAGDDSRAGTSDAADRTPTETATPGASGAGQTPTETATPPAGNASQEDWADWVIAANPGVDEAEVRAMKRDDLRGKYGPTA
ncbi:hypothetical protein ACIBBG_32020 [Micromonospora chersina]|uniref:hypothetical protein n=1 Tax=Micromonospora chersina TaxID=47854 RepID=UPI0037A39CFF